MKNGVDAFCCRQFSEFEVPERLKRATLNEVQNGDGNTPRNTHGTDDFAPELHPRRWEDAPIKGQHRELDQGGAVCVCNLCNEKALTDSMLVSDTAYGIKLCCFLNEPGTR